MTRLTHIARHVPNFLLHASLFAAGLAGLVIMGIAILGLGIPKGALPAGLTAGFAALFIGVMLTSTSSLHHHIRIREL